MTRNATLKLSEIPNSGPELDPAQNVLDIEIKYDRVRIAMHNDINDTDLRKKNAMCKAYPGISLYG